MVDAAVAGVLFTANPVTGRRRQAVIDASPGLGEAVVSGAVNPDHFVVDTRTGAILERRLGDKRLAIRATAGGGTRHVGPARRSDAPCLTDEQVTRAGRARRAGRGALRRAAGHRVGHRRRRHAVADPGAADHHAVPAAGRAPRRRASLRVYFCFNVAQGLYRPITPMGVAAFRPDRCRGRGARRAPGHRPARRAAVGGDVVRARSASPRRHPQIATGHRIIVDGAAGTVMIEKPPD